MQLSTDQIQHLFSFTEKKAVRWYDLQLELVDHLASSIEELMNKDTSLSFETALDKVYTNFGIAGFSRVVQEKEVQVKRAARKIWWKEIKAFFAWPGIFLLAGFTAVSWQLGFFLEANLLMNIFAAVYILVSIVMLIYVFRFSRGHGKLLLLQAGSFHYSGIFFIYESVILFGNHDFSRLESCICITIGLIIQVASFQLYNKVKTQAEKLYPGFFANLPV